MYDERDNARKSIASGDETLENPESIRPVMSNNRNGEPARVGFKHTEEEDAWIDCDREDLVDLSW